LKLVEFEIPIRATASDWDVGGRHPRFTLLLCLNKSDVRQILIGVFPGAGGVPRLGSDPTACTISSSDMVSVRETRLLLNDPTSTLHGTIPSCRIVISNALDVLLEAVPLLGLGCLSVPHWAM